LVPSKLQIKNWKCLEALTIVPGQQVMLVVGPNGTGKTTVLDAFAAVLCGKGEVPEVPIRQGADVAEIRLTLREELADKYEIIRALKRDGAGVAQYFHVYELGADGVRQSVRQPQTVVSALFSPVSFSPAAFSRADDKTRVQLLLDAIGATQVYTQNRAEYRAMYDGRTETNRQVDAGKRELAGPLADPAPDQSLQAIGTAELREELNSALTHNQRREAANQCVQQLVESIRAIDMQIALLKQQREERVAEHGRAIAGYEAMAPEINAEDLADRVRAVEAHNQRVRLQLASRAQRAALEQLRAQAAKATERLRGLDRALEVLIEQSEIGQAVPGLSMRDGRLFLNDLPLEQASGRQLREVSTLVGIATNPRLRVMCLDEADAIDDEGLQHYAALARQHNMQMWLAGVRLAGAELPDAQVVDLRAPHTSPAGIDATDI